MITFRFDWIILLLCIFLSFGSISCGLTDDGMVKIVFITTILTIDFSFETCLWRLVLQRIHDLLMRFFVINHVHDFCQVLLRENLFDLWRLSLRVQNRWLSHFNAIVIFDWLSILSSSAVRACILLSLKKLIRFKVLWVFVGLWCSYNFWGVNIRVDQFGQGKARRIFVGLFETWVDLFDDWNHLDCSFFLIIIEFLKFELSLRFSCSFVLLAKVELLGKVQSLGQNSN